jgi:putative ABC transport system permease protein
MDEPRWRRYLRFRGPDVDADVDDELKFHLEMCELDLRAEGLAPEQARQEALARFGDVTRVRGWLRRHDRTRLRGRDRAALLDGWSFDVRYAIRKLRQAPGFTAAIVAVLALGIGVTTAMFSAVDTVLLRPLPFHQPERLVTLEPIDIPFEGESFPQHTPDLLEVARQRDVFAAVAAYSPGGMDLSGVGTPLRVQVGVVTADFFSTLGIAPARGRPFQADDGRQGAPGVVMLSDGLWRRQFGGDLDILDREISLNGRMYRVVGVMPEGFAFPSQVQLWIPMPIPRTVIDLEPFGEMISSTVIARLAPGVSFAQAAQRIHVLRSAYVSPEALATSSPVDYVQPLRSRLVGDGGSALLVLFGATALVLLVACANAASLLLSRAAARRGEMTMRSVLGATPGRLARQLLVESLIIALLGGFLGVAIAWAGLGALERLVPATVSGAVALRIDARVLLFTLGVVILTGVGFGLWPAIGAPRHAERGMTRMGGTGSVGGAEGAHLRRLFVLGEIAVALILLIGAGVMLRSLQLLLTKDAGLEAERVATLEMSLARAVYGGPAERNRFMTQVLERLESDPAIEAAALADELPLRGEGTSFFLVEAAGVPTDPTEGGVYAQHLRVSGDYFRAMGIPVVRGGTMSVAAESSTGPQEIVINEKLASMFWPGENAVGKRLVLPGIENPFEIVGVVGNVGAVRLDDEPRSQMYLPLLRGGPRNLALVARGRLPPEDLMGRMREAVQLASPGQAVYNVRTMEALISATIAPRRLNTLLISLFGMLAVILAAVGVYGVIAHAVTRRTREIGVRMALGAHPRQVVGAILREGLSLTLAGTVMGLGGAWLLTRVLAGLLYGVTPRDPLTFLVAPIVLVAISMIASLVPALRAARVNPAAIMKAE